MLLQSPTVKLARTANTRGSAGAGFVVGIDKDGKVPCAICGFNIARPRMSFDIVAHY